MFKHSLKYVYLLAVALPLLPSCAFAQAVAGLGAISGTVRDASGAVVSDAAVTVTNASKGFNRKMPTTEGGLFAAPSVTPAPGYKVEVEKPGFAKWQSEDFEVLVGQTVDFKVVLQVGSSSTKVEVTAEAPLVEHTKTGVGMVIGQNQIDNLPINGRRVDSYVLSTPAVTNDGAFGLISFRGIAMGNSFLTDGNDTTNSFYNENAGRTRIGSQISQDAVQEFQVLSNGFSAEFGRAMGGVINTVTRSGTNSIHGTGYGFYRSSTLEALDRYANGIRTPEHRDTVGFSVGGPIKKDKLFYFVNYDYTGRNFPGINRIVNNSNNSFTDAAGNTVPLSNCNTSPGMATVAQCTAAINFVQKQMNVTVPRTYNQHLGFAKIDWQLNDRNSVSFDLNAMHWVSPHGIQTQTVLTNGNLLGNNANSTVEDRYGKASWTFVPSATAVNELRFGWFKDRLSDPGASDLWPSTGPLYITIAGSTVGAGQAYPRTFPSENRFQLVDNYSWTTGTHSAKFGVDFSTTQDWMNQLFNQYGGYSYSNITGFARDFNGGTFNSGGRNYTSFSQQLGNPFQNIRTTDINFYIQDTWKPTQKFSLNYGLRYEKTFLPQPTMMDPAWPQTGKIPSPGHNFAPRIGLAYSINDHTVIRAGYGIFYARLHGNLMDTLFLGNGLYQTPISLTAAQAAQGAPVFPNLIGSGTPTGVKLAFAAPDFHSPYTQQGTVAIEHQFGRNIGFTASYIWSRGIGLFTQRDLNLGAGTMENFTVKDLAGNTVNSFASPVYTLAGRPYKSYSNILQVENGGQSWYNGLALQFEKRFSRGFQAQVVYTWSHAIDDADQQGASWNVGSNFNNSTLPGDYRFDKGSSTLDQRHRASINWVWQPQLMNNKSALAKYAVNGWQLAVITTLASAQPVSAVVNSVSTSSGGIFPGIALANSTFNGSGGWTRVPFLPVNSLDVDRTYNVDARINHVWPIGEHMKLSIGFEAFNLFNTIRNTGIVTAAYNLAAGGIFTPSLTTTAAGSSYLLGAGNASQGFPDGTNARRCQVLARINF